MSLRAHGRSSLVGRHHTATLLFLSLVGAPLPFLNAQQAVTVSVAERGLHHVEPQLASNPRDPREIVVAAMQVRSTELSAWEVVAFRSGDSGASWQPSPLPAKEGVRCSADPWVAWGHDRSVYVACMAPVPTADGKDFTYEVFLHRSRDAGRTWAAPLQAPVDRAGQWDHPVLVKAPSPSDTATDVLWIVGTRARSSSNEFGIVRYHDRGARFDSMRVYRPSVPANYSFGSAATLDGERVVFTYFRMSERPPYPLYAVQVSPAGFRSTLLREHVMPAGFPMLTAIPAKGSSPRTLAAVWLEGAQIDGLDVVASQSKDGGETWRSPQIVTSDQPRVFRTRPNVASDGHGALAFTWYESATGSPCGDIKLRVLDEGGSVVGDRRFSRGPTPCPTERPLSAIVERWRGGGDYSGVQGIAPGMFDLVWADVREDGHHVRFARVQVRSAAPDRTR